MLAASIRNRPPALHAPADISAAGDPTLGEHLPATAGCHAPEQGWPSDTQRLVAAARDAMSIPRSRVALLLQISQLAPPLPRRHHRRIAAAILEDAARQNQGESFELASGDMVLLCHMPEHAGGSLHPDILPQALARLFAADVPPGMVLTRLWHLERDGAALLAYVAGLG